jgi:hypothetical protein
MPNTTQIWHEPCPYHEYDPVADVSGLRVDADKPILAFAGHVCDLSPLSGRYCSHTEAAIPPEAALGGARVAVAPEPGAPWELRVVATEPGTTLAITPPPPTGTKSTLVRPGESVAFQAAAAAYLVEASAPVLVTATGWGSDDGHGPEMTTALDPTRGRTHVAMGTAAGFEDAIVTVVGPWGTTVTLGAKQIALQESIGGSTWAVGTISVLANPGSVLHLVADAPVTAQIHARAPVPDDPSRSALYWHPMSFALDAP